MLCVFFPGAGYDDSTAGQEKEDDAVFPGGYYEYVWDISPKDGPTANDPECLTYSYSSQVDTVRDVNSGLIGALLICKSSQCAVGQRGALISQTRHLNSSAELKQMQILLVKLFNTFPRPCACVLLLNIKLVVQRDNMSKI